MASIPQQPGLGTAPPPPLAGHAAQALGAARGWLAKLIVLFMALPLLLFGRLMWLTVAEGRPPGAPVEISTAPPRADILDRNGRTLARTFEAVAIAADPSVLVGDPVSLSHAVAAILPGSNPEQIAAALTGSGRFQYIARRALPAEANRINALGEPAIFSRKEAERLYPNLRLAAHVLGYTDVNGRGAAGVERSFETRLANPQQRHQPLMLAMDVRVQQALEDELSKVFLDQGAKKASGVIMDVNTGEVLAMASYPDYNPNRLQAGDEQFHNNVTGDAFELGSTFKAITIASALEAGSIKSLNQQYDATHPLRVQGRVIHDDHAQNRWLNVPEIFIHSSNIGAALIAKEAGRDVQIATLEALGFFRPVDIELEERAHPVFLRRDQWTEQSMMVISFGHTNTVSLLHMANAYATIVNGGIFRTPTLLKRDVPPPGRRVFSPATSQAMLKLLRLVVTNGTGRFADAAGYRVGGKTGTAERLVDGRYDHHSNLVNFAAVFPVDQPRYVIMAMVEDPKGTAASSGVRTAGYVIAPAIKRIVERIGPQLGVVPDVTRDLDTSGLLRPQPKGGH
ncbi:MAG: penicillin-binding protein 2 [Sphingomonadales bacterium]|jgi:cell division protein FtsI (penicillin-binding protein 3)